MPPDSPVLVRRWAVALICALLFAACGADATADDPPKSRGRIVADACHAAYAELQNTSPQDGWADTETRFLVESYAHLVAFTTDYCEGGR